jgi:4-hydroxybenzoate polyprenyltransferase
MNAVTASPGRLRTYLRLGRVSNLPTVWTNVLAGLLLADGTPDTMELIPVLVSMTLFYTGGMFLNDAFDHVFDRELRPERPIPSGSIGLREVYGAGFAQLALGILLLAVPNWWLGAAPRADQIAAGLALALLITYYNYRHKVDPLSPLVMALCRAMIYLIASKIATTVIVANTFWGIVVLLGYLIGLTYAAKSENLKAVQNLWPLAFLAAPFIYAVPTALGSLFVSGVMIVFLAWVVYALSHLFGKDRNIPRCVISLIAGISLLDALLIAQATGSALWTGVAALGFLLTLYAQRYIAGT